MSNSFSQPAYRGKEELLRGIADDDPQLSVMIIAAALEDEDRDFVEATCLRLSTHANDEVRGNAILGLGHLARLFGEVSDSAVACVKRGLSDSASGRVLARRAIKQQRLGTGTRATRGPFFGWLSNIVEGHQEAHLAQGAGEHHIVGAARCVAAHPGDVVTGAAQRVDGDAREVFVREDPHRRIRRPVGRHAPVGATRQRTPSRRGCPRR